jgi:hypothetical protein
MRNNTLRLIIAYYRQFLFVEYNKNNKQKNMKCHHQNLALLFKI